VTRGAPGAWSRLALPDRELRIVDSVRCPECHDKVATRRGLIAGHYAVGTELCSGSSQPIPKETER